MMKENLKNDIIFGLYVLIAFLPIAKKPKKKCELFDKKSTCLEIFNQTDKLILKRK